MLKCRFCPRKFDNPQARRGHYRACPSKPRPGFAAEPRLNRQEPGIGFANEPGSAGSDLAEIHIPMRSTLTSNYLLGMIEAHDLLAILRKRCQGRLWFYKFIDSCVKDGPTFQDWSSVTMDMLQCEQDVGELVQRASVRRDRVWTVYKRVVDVQERWIPWAVREVTHIWRKREKKDAAMTWEGVAEDYGLPMLKDHFTRLIDLLRQLTAMTRMGV